MSNEGNRVSALAGGCDPGLKKTKARQGRAFQCRRVWMAARCAVQRLFVGRLADLVGQTDAKQR
jgi:hypothetical protein